MPEPLLEVRALVKRFGGLLVTDAVTFDLGSDEVHALIGPNGAGKTTLTDQLTGVLLPDAGTIRFDGHDVTRLAPWRRARLGMARTFQVSSVFREFSVVENVELAVQARSGHSFRFWRPVRAERALHEAARETLARVGLESRAGFPAGALSHGERRQLEIAMALASRPKVLLLDEPMAGMGTEESRRLLEFLTRLKGKLAMFLIEHDMEAVFALADTVSVLVDGRVIASGTGERVRSDPAVRRAYLGEEDRAGVAP